MTKNTKIDFSILLKDFSGAIEKAQNAIMGGIGSSKEIETEVVAVLDIVKQQEQQSVASRALFDAVEKGDIKTLKQAFAAGVRINYTDMSGNSLLSRAVAAGSEKSYDFLVSIGADLNFHKGPNAFTPIEQATIADNKKLFNKLAKKNVVVDKEKLISLAERNGSYKVLAVLNKKSAPK